MPYTIEELRKNAYYQQLHAADEIEYQHKLNTAREKMASLASANAVPTTRDEFGAMLSFEDINTKEALEDPTQIVAAPNQKVIYRRDSELDNIIKRQITELVS